MCVMIYLDSYPIFEYCNLAPSNEKYWLRHCCVLVFLMETLKVQILPLLVINYGIYQPKKKNTLNKCINLKLR